MSDESTKTFDASAAARAIWKQNQETHAILSELASHITGLRAQVQDLAAKLAAKQAAQPQPQPQPQPMHGTYTARTARDAKKLINRNGKEMVFLNVKHDGEYMDLIVSGKYALAASILGEGSKIQYELTEAPERKPAVDRDGTPILAKKTGQQIINISAFASHFKVIEAEIIGEMPRREDAYSCAASRNDPPPQVDPLGFSDDIPF